MLMRSFFHPGRVYTNTKKSFLCSSCSNFSSSSLVELWYMAIGCGAKKCLPFLFADNATRDCLPTGIWANRSDYGSCVPLDFGFKQPETPVSISEETTTIYFTGYTVSIVALTLAIWIFTHFKYVSCYGPFIIIIISSSLDG